MFSQCFHCTSTAKLQKQKTVTPAKDTYCISKNQEQAQSEGFGGSDFDTAFYFAKDVSQANQELSISSI